ncbi:MAG TPA: DegT/DnrJ/EryC1/StrS family aminotransferase, partial [Candidatus Saccharibacteria bacterium]|nr:DegT/DnrJ/EryC1/StrS family aminotransferase [Candidatus Saccharibacteria bacterium]
MITIAAPIIEGEERQAVNDVMNSGMLAQGPKVAELEAAFAEYCGTKYAIAVNSGTAAIHAALHAAGVGAGDEVITTPFSFIATINPILMLGAKPVLVDIDPNTFNINVTKIEAAITPKTKAIIPVDLYGQPCDWDEIRAIANKHNLKLIEDACQAVGARYGEEHTGSLGDLGCFSLYATKNIMCGEGGVITTDNEEYANSIRAFRQHGMVAPYEYEGLGFNYRMTDLHAAIAVEQLKKADAFTAARQKNAELLNERLKDVAGIRLPSVKDGRSHVYHQYTILLEDAAVSRELFIERLRDKGVGAGVYYPKPLHSYPHIAALGYSLGDYPVAERIAARVVSLPVHPKVSEGDIEIIATAVQESLSATS